MIENVVGAPLLQPIRLCGSSFGLRVRRHRLFESNVQLAGRPCDHTWQNADRRFDIYDHGHWFKSGIVHVFGNGGGKAREHGPAAMAIDWMTWAELIQAIPPAYTRHGGLQLVEALRP